MERKILMAGKGSKLEHPSDSVEAVIDFITCPRCGSDGAYYERYHSGLQEVLICSLCGYVKDIKTEMHLTKGSGVDPYPRIGEDGKPVQHIVEINGCGGYCFANKNGRGERGPMLEEFVDEEAISWFNDVLRQNPDMDHDTSYLTRYQDGRIIYLAGSPEWAENIEKTPPTARVPV